MLKRAHNSERMPLRVPGARSSSFSHSFPTSREALSLEGRAYAVATTRRSLPPPPPPPPSLVVDNSDAHGGEGVVEVEVAAKAHGDAVLQTPTQVSLNIVKVVCGAASFSLPWGFQKAGLTAGVLGVLFVAGLTYATVKMLIQSKRAIAERTGEPMHYAAIAKFALGSRWDVVVMAATAMSCIGACAGYLTFVAALGAEYGWFDSIIDWYPLSALEPQGRVAVLIAPFFLALALMRHYRYLAFTSLLGDLSFVLALLVIFVDGATHHKPLADWSEYEQFRPDTFFLFFGPTAFLFTIHYCAIPIEDEMQEPKLFFVSLRTSIVFCAVLNIAVGMFGYIYFAGDEGSGCDDAVCDIIIQNLDKSGFAMVVSTALAVDLLFTYALLLAPPREYLENWLLDPRHPFVEWQRNLLRSGFVAVTVVVAIAVPRFNVLVGLVGGVTDTLLAFILPPLIFANVCGDGMGWAGRAGLYALACFGVVLMVLTVLQNAQHL